MQRPAIRSRTRAAAVLAAALLLGACSMFAPKFEKPELSIVGVEVLKGDLFQQRLKVRVQVRNPNDYELPVEGLAYDIEVAGNEFAHGESANAFTVPARGEAEFDMNVRANLGGALIAILGQRDSPDAAAVAYRLVGKVTLAKGLMRSVPFEERGSFRLR